MEDLAGSGFDAGVSSVVLVSGVQAALGPPSMNGWVAPLSAHLLLLRLADANPSGAGYVHTRVGHASSSCCWWCCYQRKDISSETSIDILLE